MSGTTAAASAGTGKAATAPPFPTFLLPSISIPFRRRRQSTQQSTSSSASPGGEDVPEPPPLSTSVDSASSADTPTPTADAAPAQPQPQRRLSQPSPATLRCARCATDLAFAAQIVSKGFTGRHGRAFLVSAPTTSATLTCPASPISAPHPASPGDLVNIRVGREENRQLVTGAHVVADISCRVCGAKVGWKYVNAREAAQKYKVGKFILETARVVGWRGWGDDRGAGVDDGLVGDDEDYDEDDDGGFGLSLGGASSGSGAARRTALAGGKETQGGPDGTEAGAEGGPQQEEEPVMFDSEDDDECEDIFAGTWDADAVAKRRRLRRALAARNNRA